MAVINYEPLSQEPLSQEVFDRIAQDIIYARLAPGTRLRETHLAEVLGVSRSPIREALRRLATEGLVEITPRKGARVATLDVRDGCDHYDCRIIIEPPCYRMAVEAMSDADARWLGDLFAQMSEAVSAGDAEQYLQLDIQYHDALVKMCPNRKLADLVELTWRKAMCYRYLILRRVGRPEHSLSLHVDLQRAIEQRDPSGVEQAARSLLLDARDVLASYHGPLSANDRVAEV